MSVSARPPSEFPTLTSYRDGKIARIARSGSLVLGDINTLLPEDDGDPMDDALRALWDAAEVGPVGLLMRVRNSRPPPAESRRRLFDTLKQLQDRFVVGSISLEGQGFRAAAFRSFLAAAHALRLTPAPILTYSSIQDARASVEKVLDASFYDAGGITSMFEAGVEPG